MVKTAIRRKKCIMIKKLSKITVGVFALLLCAIVFVNAKSASANTKTVVDDSVTIRLVKVTQTVDGEFAPNEKVEMKKREIPPRAPRPPHKPFPSQEPVQPRSTTATENNATYSDVTQSLIDALDMKYQYMYTLKKQLDSTQSELSIGYMQYYILQGLYEQDLRNILQAI